MRRLLEEQTKTGIIKMGRGITQEALQEALVEDIPPLPMWTRLADEVLFIHQGKAYSAWRRPEFW